MEYLPFGETLVDEHLNSYNSPFKFNAKELDPETGNYYYGARYYDPKSSLWLSIDPLAEKYPNFSPYAYTFQNPLNFVDPTGMEGEPNVFKRGWDAVGRFFGLWGKEKSVTLVKKTVKVEVGELKLISFEDTPQTVGGYPGQALEDLFVKGIELLGEQISKSDVSSETANNTSLGLNVLAVIVSKGKNKAADKNLIENIVTKTASKNFKGVTESFLKKNGIKDIHAFKAEWLGTDKNLKLFDVVKNTATKELMIIRKETQEIIVNTKIIAK